MKRFHVIQLLLVVALSVGAAVAVGRYVIRMFFFDRVYYQKSASYGYFSSSDFNNIDLMRSRFNGVDVIPVGDLSDGMNLNSPMRISRDYNVAVIGDSYVWGQGVLVRERFSDLLRNRLNRIRKTNVYVFGMPGNNVLDNVSKYVLIQSRLQIDAYVFVFVLNDIFMNRTNWYPSTLQDYIVKTCRNYGPYTYDENVSDADWNAYVSRIMTAWENPANICVYNLSVMSFPRDGIYVIVDNYDKKIDYTRMKRIALANGLDIREIERDSKGIEEFRRYWPHSDVYFKVSSVEGHPSRLAHSMYAEYLYNEFITNPRWNFVESDDSMIGQE